MNEILALLLIAFAAPFIGAIIAGLTRKRVSYFISMLAAVVLLAITAGASWTAYLYYSGTSETLNFGPDFSFSLPWLRDAIPAAAGVASGNMFGILFDPLGIIGLLAVAIVGFLIVMYTTDYIQYRYESDPSYDGRRSYFFWLLLFIGSLVGVVLSPSLLQMFVFWEINGFCTWALISNNPKEAALRAGFKALIMTHIGGLAFLIAMLMTFAGTGSFAFAAIGSLAPAAKGAAIMLFLVAAWAKCAQVPFQRWLPDALESPTPLSSYLPVAGVIKPGLFLMARLVISVPEIQPAIGVVMAAAAIVTIFLAVLAYFRQNDLNRLVGYVAMVGMAYVFIGFSLYIAGSKEGYQGALLYMLCDGVAKGTLILSVCSIAYGAGNHKISDLRGLAKKMPLESFAFLIGTLAATGVPPFAGFWPKFMIFTGTLQAPNGWLLLTLLAAESVISFGWLLWVGQQIFFGEPSPVAAAADDPPLAMSVALVVGMILCLVMPLIGIPLVNLFS
jgi:hydrogenase-4 component D